jgi:hypothetical protein
MMRDRLWNTGFGKKGGSKGQKDDHHRVTKGRDCNTLNFALFQDKYDLLMYLSEHSN